MELNQSLKYQIIQRHGWLLGMFFEYQNMKLIGNNNQIERKRERERPRRRPSMSKITCVMVGVAMAVKRRSQGKNLPFSLSLVLFKRD